MFCFRSALATFVTLAALAISGCGVSRFNQPTPAASTLPTIQGTLHGGQQPVSGASIQLYAANTTVSKGASTALITTATVLTDANGSFTIAGTFTCTSTALVYIVATGGNPGLPGSVTNSAIAEMAVIGTCGTITTSTFISINELTTVAAVESLAPFMADFAHVGANAANVASLTTAFANATAFVDPSTGQFRPSTGNVVAPIAQLNSLADILSACINTAGGVSGDNSPCGKLFQYTSSSDNIIVAMLAIVRSPTVNVTLLFSLVVPASPFLPVLPSAPVSWAPPAISGLGTNYTHVLDQLLADSQGHIWLLQPYAGTVTQYDSNLNVLYTFNVGSITSGGTALHMTLDPSDNLWVPYGSALLKISSSGTILSPATGYPITQTNLASYTNQSFTSDSAGNIWGIVIRAADNAVCAIEYSNSGVLVSPATGYCGSQVLGGSTTPTVIVPDSAGNVYLFFFGTGTSPIEKFSASGAYTDLPTPTYYSVSGYDSAVFDPKYQHFWASDSVVLDNLSLSGTVNSTTYNTNFIYGVVTPFNNGLAVDGGGNLWIATDYGTLAEFGPTGTIISGCTLSYVCGIPVVASQIGQLAGIAIDPAGDVFTVDVTDGTLLRYPGIAAAK